MADEDRTPPPRLVWQCRRGMRELDLLLGGFLEHGYAALAPDERKAFEHLLEYPDQLLFDYLLGGMPASDPAIAALVRRIKQEAIHGQDRSQGP